MKFSVSSLSSKKVPVKINWRQFKIKSRFSSGKKVVSGMVFMFSAYDCSLGGVKNGKLSKRERIFLVSFFMVDGQKIIPCSMSCGITGMVMARRVEISDSMGPSKALKNPVYAKSSQKSLPELIGLTSKMRAIL